MTGDEKLLGKRVGKDARLGKLTFPAVWGIEESRAEAARQAEAAGAALEEFPETDAKRAILELCRRLLTRNT